MPGFNQTGPLGQGSMTGHRKGKCTNFGANKKKQTYTENEELKQTSIENEKLNKKITDIKLEKGFGFGRGKGRRGFGLGRQNQIKGGQ